MQHIAEIRQLRALDLVNLDYPSCVGPHDLQDVLQPLTRLTALRTLGLHVRPTPLLRQCAPVRAAQGAPSITPCRLGGPTCATSSTQDG